MEVRQLSTRLGLEALIHDIGYARLPREWEKGKAYDHHYLKAFISFLAGRAPGAAKRA